MKTGILTFHRAGNYGAFLQAFALKTVVESFGTDAEFVDYWPEGHSDAYRIFRPEAARGPKNFVRECGLAVYRFTKSCVFGCCRRKYLKVPSRPAFSTMLSLFGYSADRIVYGSDQIWWKGRLTEGSGFDPVYFGEGVSADIRKIAYAPSVGIMNLDDSDKTFLRCRLGNFSSLSAREASLSDLMTELSGREVPVVLDPVLLKTPDFWAKHCRAVPRRRYVLCYTLSGNEETISRAMDESRGRGVRLILLNASMGSWHNLNFRSAFSSPFDFVSLVRDAECVVTDSFHGVAFSLLFGRQFVMAGLKQNTERITSLLDRLGVEDGCSYDAEAVAGNLERERELSLSYLKTALCEQ